MGSPVDKEVQDALDRLEHFLANGDPRANPMVDIATVRSALEQLREERDAAEEWLGNETRRRQAAEVEVTRLTNKLNEDSQNFEIECLKAERDRLEYRAEAAEAEVQRYREGLRELLGPNPNYDPDGQHDYGWENEPPKPFAPRWVRDKVDALLADRPDEPWESFAASQGGIFNGPHPADVEPDGGGAK